MCVAFFCSWSTLLRRCDLDSHHFRHKNFFARSRMRRESFGLDSVLGLRWGRCSTFITKKWNGIPLPVLSVYSWKVLSCCICSHSIKIAIFPWARVVLIRRHMIANIVMNTAFTCTEAMQVLSAWREDVIWLLNLCVQFEFILFFIQKVCAGGVTSFFFRPGALRHYPCYTKA
jgi:hypothetical protein